MDLGTKWELSKGLSAKALECLKKAHDAGSGLGPRQARGCPALADVARVVERGGQARRCLVVLEAAVGVRLRDALLPGRTNLLDVFRLAQAEQPERPQRVASRGTSCGGHARDRISGS